MTSDERLSIMAELPARMADAGLQPLAPAARSGVKTSDAKIS
jgi:hypothetical protein